MTIKFNRIKFHHALIALAFTAALFTQANAVAQTANGRATTASPSYITGTANPLSLDTAGNLRVNCVTGCSGGGGGSDVNINAVGGNPVTSTVPISGTVSSTVSGTVGVSSLPSIPAGSNTIGNVGVTTLPALPSGSNTIGNVGVTSLPSLPAGSNAIGSVVVSSLPAVPQGTYSTYDDNATTTPPTVLKASAGRVYYFSVFGTTAGAMLLYDASTTAGITCVTTPPKLRLVNAANNQSFFSFPDGVNFNNGIVMCSSASNTKSMVYN